MGTQAGPGLNDTAPTAIAYTPSSANEAILPAVSATAQSSSSSSSINTWDHSLHAADGAVTIALTQQPGGSIKVELIVTASPRQPTQTAPAAAVDSLLCESPPGIPPAVSMAVINSGPAGAPAPDLQRMPGHAADTAADASPNITLAANTEPCTGQPAAEPAISPTQGAPTAESATETTTDHEQRQSPSQMSHTATTTSPALPPAGAAGGTDMTAQEDTAAGTPHSANSQQPSSDAMQGFGSTQHPHGAGPSPQEVPAAAAEGVAATADSSTAAGSTQPQAAETDAAAPQGTSVAAEAEAGVTQADHAPSALPATAQTADGSEAADTSTAAGSIQPSSDTMQGLGSTQHPHEAGPSPLESLAAAGEAVVAAAADDTSAAAGSTQHQAAQTDAAAPQGTSVAAEAEAGATQTQHVPSALPATAQTADDSPPAAAAAADGSSTDSQVISYAGRTLVFYGPPACSVCGFSGHAANNCSTPFCFKCDVFGHSPGRCDEACQDCGQCHDATTDGRCTAPHCQECHMAGHTQQQCPRALCPSCGCYGHQPTACRACAHCHLHSHSTVDCPNPHMQDPPAAQSPTARTPSAAPDSSSEAPARTTTDVPPAGIAEASTGQQLSEGPQATADNIDSFTAAPYPSAAADTGPSKDPQQEIERIKQLWAQQASQQRAPRSYGAAPAAAPWSAADSAAAADADTHRHNHFAEPWQHHQQQQQQQQEPQHNTDAWGCEQIDSFGPYTPNPSAVPSSMPSQDIRLEQASGFADRAPQRGRYASTQDRDPQPGSPGRSHLQPSSWAPADRTEPEPDSNAGSKAAAAAEIDRIKQLWAEEAAGQQQHYQRGRAPGLQQSHQPPAERHPAGAMPSERMPAAGGDDWAHDDWTDDDWGSSVRATAQQAHKPEPPAAARHPPSMQYGAEDAAWPEDDAGPPARARAAAAGSTPAAEPRSRLAAAGSGSMRAAVMQLAAAVRERVDLDREAAPRRQAARRAAARTAGSAVDAAMAARQAPAAARVAAAARLGMAPAAREEQVVSQDVRQAFRQADVPAVPRMHPTLGQPARVSRNGAAAVAAAADMAATDSDDDLPPGFERKPPGFSDRPVAVAPATAADVDDVPPGFEARAHRIQAALGRSQQSSLTAQLQQPGTAKSAHSSHSIVGTTSLRSSAPQEQQHRAPELQPGFSQERLNRSTGPLAASSTAGPTQPSSSAQVGPTVAERTRKRSRQKRRYLFLAGPVCRECGAAGHEEFACSTPYCQQCNLFGHSEGSCASACSSCGWQHRPPLDDGCQYPLCSECQLWGHDAIACPDAQCNRCQCWGHARELCPGYCRKCHQPGHTTETCRVQRCTLCQAASHDASQCPLQDVRDSLTSPGGDQLMPWDVQAVLRQQHRESDTGRTAPSMARAGRSYEPEASYQQPPPQQQQELQRPSATYQRRAVVGSQDVRFQQAEPDELLQGFDDTESPFARPPGAVQPALGRTRLDSFGSRQGVGTASGDRSGDRSGHNKPAAAAHTDSESASSWLEMQQVQRRGTGALARGRRAVTAAPVAPAAGEADSDEDDDVMGVPVDLDAGGSDDDEDYGAFATSRRGSKRSKEVQPAPAAARPAYIRLPSAAAAGGPVKTSSSAGASGLQPGDPAWAAALQQLLSCSSDVKWRAILPSGDRVGPFSASELAGWLGGGGGRGRAPKGVGSAEAREVEADQGALQLCAISAKDYNPQKLPGAKFYKPLSALLPAIAAGMTYTPVTRADLAKSYPAAGWNESSAAASRMAAPIAAPRAAAAPAASRAPAISIPAALSRQPVAAAGQSMRSSSAGGGGRAAAAPGSKAWEQGLQQLLGRGDVKWRAVMPSGDRLGPFSQVELLGWLVGGGRAPKGVSREDARDAAADPGKLKICGIASKDYNMQKLPGLKYYLPLDDLVTAVGAGLTYTPVTKADLQKGVPAQGWNTLA